MHHEKKIQSQFYDRLIQHLKMFEVRKEDDVVFNEGDTISFKDLDGKRLNGKWTVYHPYRNYHIDMWSDNITHWQPLPLFAK